MVKFDVVGTFDVDNAHDCESIERSLALIEDAGNYGIDFTAELERAKKILERRKIELGCE